MERLVRLPPPTTCTKTCTPKIGTWIGSDRTSPAGSDRTSPARLQESGTHAAFLIPPSARMQADRMRAINTSNKQATDGGRIGTAGNGNTFSICRGCIGTLHGMQGCIRGAWCGTGCHFCPFFAAWNAFFPVFLEEKRHFPISPFPFVCRS